MRAIGRDASRGTAPALRGGAVSKREWLLLFGFVLVVVAGALTVALPELSKEPDAEAGAAHEAAARAK